MSERVPELATVLELVELTGLDAPTVRHNLRRARLRANKRRQYHVLPFLQALSQAHDKAEHAGKADHLKQYRFKKGQSGNPAGRPKGKSVTTQLRAIIEERGQARELAESAIEHALAGDFRYWQGILERLEGKVPMVVGVAEVQLEPAEAAALQAQLLEAASLEAIDYEAALEPAKSGKNGRNGKNGRRRNGRRAR